MACFSWNVRGFNKSLKHSVVSEWLKSREMKFGCILETRVKEIKAEKILGSVFLDWSAITNYEDSKGGRIWFLWRDSVRVTPVYKSDQLITCMVELENEEVFYCSSVYASNFVEERRKLWEDLLYHHNSACFKNKAWMIMGDFNEILEGAESSSFITGRRIPNGMREFQSAVLSCQLTDMASQGPLHTWCNKREEGVICRKLDRVLMNEVALHRFSNAYTVFEPGGCSDHLRSSIQLLPRVEKIRRPFKYANVIGSLPEFLPLVQEFWGNTEKLFHSTSAMYRFSKKLKALKPLIRELGKIRLGNLSKRAKEAYEDFCGKQNPSDSSIREESKAYGKWLNIASLEEDFLKQRAKLHWLEIGDQNNKIPPCYKV